MSKNTKWEPKTKVIRNAPLSSKATKEEKEQIVKAAYRAGMNTSDFLRTTALQEKIVVIPEGREILTTMQEFRNLLRPLEEKPAVKTTDRQHSQITTNLPSSLTRH